MAFEADAGPFTGLKMIGFAIWERRAGGRHVTFPARQYSVNAISAMLDATLADDRTILLRATSQELGLTREAVIEAATQRLELSRKHALDAYGLAEQHESNPRSVWGYVEGLTRLSQRTPWQDARFTLDRAASRLLTTVQ